MRAVESLNAAEAYRLGADRAELAILNHPRLSQPQVDFASSRERFLLWRGGNSIGKSWGHSWDLVHFARGTHLWRSVPAGPRKIMVAGFSFAQMDPLMEKLWLMLPKGEIHPKLYFAPGQGIKGFKEPVIPFIAGPGAGSVIYLATYEQGTERIMGFQGHRLSMDEPPPASLYGEARPRLNYYRGEMRITFTPTPSSPPLAYMRKEVEEGRVVEIQTTYNQAACTIRGGLVPWAWKREPEIEEDIGNYLPDERPMRRDGAWDPVVSGRWLEKVTDAIVVEEPLPPGRWYFAVGIDHGTRPGREWATLLAANAQGEYRWLDEAHEEGVTSMADDASNILKMLERNGLTWEEVDHWVGDRRTAESTWGSPKSNADLTDALAAELDIPARELRERGLRIVTAFKDRGSVRRGATLINQLAATDRLRIHRRCQGFIGGAKVWRGEEALECKDPIDSGRYGLIVLHDRLESKSVDTFGRIH